MFPPVKGYQQISNAFAHWSPVYQHCDSIHYSLQAINQVLGKTNEETVTVDDPLYGKGLYYCFGMFNFEMSHTPYPFNVKVKRPAYVGNVCF